MGSASTACTGCRPSTGPLSFEAETRQALQVLDELLASDEDMLAALSGAGPTSVDPERHGVVELLLEAYRRLSAVAGDVAELRGRSSRRRNWGGDTHLNRNNIIKSTRCGIIAGPSRTSSMA